MVKRLRLCFQSFDRLSRSVSLPCCCGHCNIYQHEDGCQIRNCRRQITRHAHGLQSDTQCLQEAKEQGSTEYFRRICHTEYHTCKCDKAAALMPSVKQLRNPRDRCAPAKPQKIPHKILEITFILTGLIPAVSSASGCSPAARSQKP